MSSKIINNNELNNIFDSIKKKKFYLTYLIWKTLSAKLSWFYCLELNN